VEVRYQRQTHLNPLPLVRNRDNHDGCQAGPGMSFCMNTQFCCWQPRKTCRHPSAPSSSSSELAAQEDVLDACIWPIWLISPLSFMLISQADLHASLPLTVAGWASGG
jgi:hypothetical protein